MDDLTSDFDLSSLIEGVVDDDSDGGHEPAEVRAVQSDGGGSAVGGPA